MPLPQTPRRSAIRNEPSASPLRPHTTQNTPQKAGLKSPNGGVDIGKRQGLYDTDVLRSRVYKWQHSSSGTWAQSENGDTSGDAELESPTPARRRGRTQRRLEAPESTIENDPSSYVNAYRPTGVATYRQRHKKIDDDIRAAAAPKKRVVSDDHWKKSRSSEDQRSTQPAESTKLTEAELAPSPSPSPLPSPSKPALANNVSSSGSPHKIANAWVRRKPDPEKERQELEEKIQSRIHMTPAGWVKPHRSPEKSPPKLEPPRYEVHLTPEGFVRQRSSSPEKLFPNNPSPSPKFSRLDINPKVHASKSTSLLSEALGATNEEKTLPIKPQRSFDLRPAPTASKPKKLEKDAVLGNNNQPKMSPGKNNFDRRKAPAIDPKHTPQTPQKNQSRQVSAGTLGSGQQKPNRIEAWLGAMPDPFVEDPEKLKGELEASPSMSESEPEKINHKSRESSGKKHRKRRDTEHGSHERHRDGESQMKDGCTISTPDDETSKSPSSVPALKRSGAKRNLHSPKKNPSQIDRIGTGLESQSIYSYSADGSALDLAKADIHEKSSPQDDRRNVSATGNRLPAIDSNNSTREEYPPMYSAAGKAGERPRLKRKLTSHADLISVLSMEPDETKSLRSARSIRTVRKKPESASLEQLMTELKTDEAKYLRELRTLVDGVIPVLLNCVLSKTNSNAAAGLFGRSHQASNATQPIVSMGIALERLKSTHSRIPYGSVDALTFWAQSTYRVYTDYINAWRLGFEDVVVNLAPSEEKHNSPVQGNDIDHGLPRNTDGDIINGDGEKVDVAFLLKRPLVRVKCLAKTLKGVAIVNNSTKLSDVAEKFQDLVTEARKRQNDEWGRLEDEAAATLDVTRTRSLKTLAPLTGVWIDPSRCVKARDIFDLQLRHSSGQQLDCRVELIIREEPLNKRIGGDVLICELDQTSRWLLTPPVLLREVSARSGDHNELVVLIRGGKPDEEPWQELLSLRTSESATVSEWKQMLGTQPVPPELPRQAVLEPSQPTDIESRLSAPSLIMPSESGMFSMPDNDIPIGEQASIPPSVVPSLTYEESVSDVPKFMPSTVSFWLPEDEAIPDDDHHSQEKKEKPKSAPISFGFSFPSTKPTAKAPSTPKLRDDRIIRDRVGDDRPRQYRTDGPPRNLDDAMASAGRSLHPSPQSKPEVAQRASTLLTSPASGDLSHDASPNSTRPRSLQSFTSSRLENLEDYQPRPSRPVHNRTTSASSISSKGYSVWLPHRSDDVDEDDPDSISQSDIGIPVRKHREHHQTTPTESPFISRIRDVFKSPKREPQHVEQWFKDHRSSPNHMGASKKLPKPQPGHLRGASLPTNLIDDLEPQKPPETPPHRSPPQPAEVNTPVLSPTGSGVKSTPVLDTTSPEVKTHRRTSSPLKHQYEPSSDSDDSSVDANVLSDDNESVSSESSAEDFVPSLPPSSAFKRGFKSAAAPDFINQPRSLGTVAPSQSASVVGRKIVPTTGAGGNKQIASIFCWSDKGVWETLHPDECSVIVSPGLIEAFEMSAAHSIPNISTGDGGLAAKPQGIKPLVGLELTPLVPLRRGTAIDISIRSPPTTVSLIKKGNNIMFRSRNNQECDILYGLINQARINNPRYIALQNARGPFGEGTWAAAMDRRSNSGDGNKSWWRMGGANGRGRGSYRAGSSRRTPSVAAHTDQTESSVATMSTAMSALKRFSAGNKMFDVAKSSIQPRGGLLSPNTRSSTTFSSDSGGGPGSGASTPPAGTGVGADPSQGTALGIRGAKIRMYERESASKWRDMGSARLTIMHPPRPPGAPPPLMKDGSLKQEKRVVVTGKTKGETLLDVTLGETSFERVARTGIALSVWEQGEVAHRGSVMAARVRVYMLQMKSERDTAYTFSLVGRLRY